MVYMPTERMVADILTKAVPRTQFENLRDMMGVGNRNGIANVRGTSLSGSVENSLTSGMECSVHSSNNSMGDYNKAIRL
jgi:hypothetical protein